MILNVFGNDEKVTAQEAFEILHKKYYLPGVATPLRTSSKYIIINDIETAEVALPDDPFDDIEDTSQGDDEIYMHSLTWDGGGRRRDFAELCYSVDNDWIILIFEGSDVKQALSVAILEILCKHLKPVGDYSPRHENGSFYSSPKLLDALKEIESYRSYPEQIADKMQ